MAGQAETTYLGLDIGTSSVKALLVDADQRVVAEASAPLERLAPPSPVERAGPGRLVRGRRGGRRGDPRARRRGAFAALAGIGLSGQMHGATLLDADDKPLRPAILWNDGRVLRRMRRAQAPRARRRETHRQSRHARLHRAEDAVGRGARAGDRQSDEARASAQGLRPSAPLGRSRVGDVGRLGHLLARRRQAALGRGSARRDRPFADRDAAARRGLGGLGASFARDRRGPGASRGARFRSPAAAATTRPRPSASARPRRRRASSRSARRASSSRSPTASSACPSARCTPSATRCPTAGTACR